MRSYFATRREEYLASVFKRDLENFLRLSEGARKAIAGIGGEAMLAKTEKDRKALLDRVAENFRSEPVGLVGPLDIARYFSRIFASDPKDEPAAADDPNEIAADLSEVGDVYPKNFDGAEQKLADALSIIKAKAMAIREELRRREYSGGVMPRLKGVATTAELRAVFDTTYGIGENVGNYKPRLVDTVAVVTIRLRLENSEVESVCFQVSEDVLSLLIDALRAAQVEMRAVKKTKKI